MQVIALGFFLGGGGGGVEVLCIILVGCDVFLA